MKYLESLKLQYLTQLLILLVVDMLWSNFSAVFRKARQLCLFCVKLFNRKISQKLTWQKKETIWLQNKTDWKWDYQEVSYLKTCGSSCILLDMFICRQLMGLKMSRRVKEKWHIAEERRDCYLVNQEWAQEGAEVSYGYCCCFYVCKDYCLLGNVQEYYTKNKVESSVRMWVYCYPPLLNYIFPEPSRKHWLTYMNG